MNKYYYDYVNYILSFYIKNMTAKEKGGKENRTEILEEIADVKIVLCSLNYDWKVWQIMTDIDILKELRICDFGRKEGK